MIVRKGQWWRPAPDWYPRDAAWHRLPGKAALLLAALWTCVDEGMSVPDDASDVGGLACFKDRPCRLQQWIDALVDAGFAVREGGRLRLVHTRSEHEKVRALRTDPVPSAYQPRTDPVPSAYQPRTDPVPSAYQPRTNGTDESNDSAVLSDPFLIERREEKREKRGEETTHEAAAPASTGPQSTAWTSFEKGCQIIRDAGRTVTTHDKTQRDFEYLIDGYRTVDHERAIRDWALYQASPSGKTKPTSLLDPVRSYERSLSQRAAHYQREEKPTDGTQSKYPYGSREYWANMGQDEFILPWELPPRADAPAT